MLQLPRWFIFLLLLIPTRLLGAPASQPTLSRQLDRLLASPELHGARVGVAVLRLSDRRVLYQRDGRLPLLPASNAKLLVAGAALEKLGPDFRFRTACLAGVKPDVQPSATHRPDSTNNVSTGLKPLLPREGGPREATPEGVLAGDLYLRGSGDPTLTTIGLSELARQLVAAGLRVVEGDLVADDSRFDRARLRPDWEREDLPWYYAAESSALSLSRNSVQVTVRPGEGRRKPASIELSPRTNYLQVSNQALTGPDTAKSQMRIRRLLGTNRVLVTGWIGARAPPAVERVSVLDPAMFCLSTFGEWLARAGIQVRGRLRRGSAPPGALELAAVESPPLSEIIPLMMKPSDNHLAEQLVRTLGASRRGVGSWESGLTEVRAWAKAAGWGWPPPDLSDGSGLSRGSRVSAGGMVRLLAHMWDSPYRQLFWSSLPEPGEGTLKRRMVGTAADGHLRAKTGTLTGACSLSGYLTTQGGEVLAFSFICNGNHGRADRVRRIQDRLVCLLAAMK